MRGSRVFPACYRTSYLEKLMTNKEGRHRVNIDIHLTHASSTSAGSPNVVNKGETDISVFFNQRVYNLNVALDCFGTTSFSHTKLFYLVFFSGSSCHKMPGRNIRLLKESRRALVGMATSTWQVNSVLCASVSLWGKRVSLLPVLEGYYGLQDALKYHKGRSEHEECRFESQISICSQLVNSKSTDQECTVQ